MIGSSYFGSRSFAAALLQMKRPKFALVRIAYAIYILAFAVGTSTHWVDILSNGWKSCRECALAANLYWLALAFIDPAAILLLLIRPIWGLRLAQVVMLTDVAVNVVVGIVDFRAFGIWTMQGLYFQVPFSVFLFATAPFVSVRIKAFLADQIP